MLFSKRNKHKELESRFELLSKPAESRCFWAYFPKEYDLNIDNITARVSATWANYEPSEERSTKQLHDFPQIVKNLTSSPGIQIDALQVHHKLKGNKNDRQLSSKHQCISTHALSTQPVNRWIPNHAPDGKNKKKARKQGTKTMTLTRWGREQAKMLLIWAEAQ